MWQTMNNVCVKVVALRAKWRTLITRAMHMQVFYLSIRASWYRSNIYQNDNTKTKIVKATHQKPRQKGGRQPYIKLAAPICTSNQDDEIYYLVHPTPYILSTIHPSRHCLCNQFFELNILVTHSDNFVPVPWAPSYPGAMYNHQLLCAAITGTVICTLCQILAPSYGNSSTHCFQFFQ